MCIVVEMCMFGKVENTDCGFYDFLSNDETRNWDKRDSPANIKLRFSFNENLTPQKISATICQIINLIPREPTYHPTLTHSTRPVAVHPPAWPTTTRTRTTTSTHTESSFATALNPPSQSD